MTGNQRVVDPWRGFRDGTWRETVDVADFVRRNHEPYTGDGAFLTGPTCRTLEVWGRLRTMFVEERRKGVYDVDAATPSTITAHAPGYLDRERELIVGLQTDAPLRRAIMPAGGLRMVEDVTQGVRLHPRPDRAPDLHQLPQDAQRRGLRRVPGRRAGRAALARHHRAARRVRARPDHRRLPAGRALRGGPADRRASGRDKAALDGRPSTDDVIRDREELAEQIRALGELKQMADAYGYDISRPAATGRRPSSGSTSRTWPPPRSRTARPCRSGGRRTSSTSTCERDLAEGRLDRDDRPGAGRRLRDQAADHPVPPHPRVRPALLRRPHLGHRGARRDGRRRPAAGHPDQLPLPADPLQPRPGAGAEPDRALVAAAARRVQAVLRPGVAGHQRHPVRER